MSYTTFAPDLLLGLGLADPAVTQGPWHVNWGTDVDATSLVADLLPSFLDFDTSGTTGPSQTWRRLRENVWREAGILAELIAPELPEAVVSFAPPTHLFGTLASILVPAHLGVPVWYRASFFGAMPDIKCRRVVVVATPWIFKLLLEHMDWVSTMEHITVLYAGAMIPTTAGDFLDRVGARGLIVEVLGSTEAGGIATRRWHAGDPPSWTLFSDVSFVDSPSELSATEVALAVHSPRLAFQPGGLKPESWEADDLIERLSERKFRLAGRRGRLVKVNGRRINLDEAENVMRDVLDCKDLALVPINDELVGEHVELLLVLAPGTELSDLALTLAFTHLGVRPKRVHAVSRIERSALGKVRHQQVSIQTTRRS